MAVQKDPVRQQPAQDRPVQREEGSGPLTGDERPEDFGVTTRDDATDMGVKMLPGPMDGSEPVGPEDALGVGPKRGDYRDRIGPSNYHPHEVVAADRKDILDPNKPSVKVEPQRPRAEDIGEVEGKKGGVDSAEK